MSQCFDFSGGGWKEGGWEWHPIIAKSGHTPADLSRDGCMWCDCQVGQESCESVFLPVCVCICVCEKEKSGFVVVTATTVAPKTPCWLASVWMCALYPTLSIFFFFNFLPFTCPELLQSSSGLIVFFTVKANKRGKTSVSPFLSKWSFFCRYTRNLVDEGNGKFNLMILCWGEGHGRWAAVKGGEPTSAVLCVSRTLQAT